MTVVALSMAVLVNLLPLVAHAQTGAPPDEWRFYGGGPGHSKYSPLDQITKDNVDQLRIAWTWTSVDETLRAENPIIRDGRTFRTYAFEATPLLVDGVLYTVTNLGQVAAIEPTTGDTLWSYDPGLYLEGRPAVHGFLTRGLAYWTDGDDARLFYAGGRTYLVSVDAETGERVWHFQFVHHTVWNYDLPAAPNLIDITVDGRPIKAVAQITKQGFTFVFDRATGEPVWPIEERPVPQSTVPGEQTSPTQPFPTRPPVYLTSGSLEADLIDFTEELRAQALEIYSPHTAGPLYTPPALGGNIVRPGWSGGANWWGAAFDPQTAGLYVPSWAHFSFVVMEPGDPARSDLTIRPRVSNLPGPQGLPLFKPPYSQLVALDMNAGEALWSVPPARPRGAPRARPGAARELRQERRPAADQDTAVHRPGHRVAHAPRLRQGYRLRGVRDGAAGAVVCGADYLHGGRCAVHRDCGRRWRQHRTAGRAGAAVAGRQSTSGGTRAAWASRASNPGGEPMHHDLASRSSAGSGRP